VTLEYPVAEYSVGVGKAYFYVGAFASDRLFDGYRLVNRERMVLTQLLRKS